MRTEDAYESNSAIDRKRRRIETALAEGLCPFCPPHGGENARGRSKHGAKRPKYKQHRRKP